MRTSEHLDQLATALAAAQAEMTNPEKTKTAKVASAKGQYTYKYADIGDGLNLLRPLLAKNGLSFIQPTVYEGDQIILKTRLMHASGQWIECDYPVCTIAGHQQMGAALTYARRYALFSLVGIAAEEDTDANGAEDVPPRTRQQQAQQRSLEKAQIGKPGGILSDPPTRGEQAIRDEDRRDAEMAERLTGPVTEHDPETGEVTSGLTEEQSAALRDQILDKLEMGKLTRPALQAWLKATEGPRNQLWPNHLQEVRTAYAAAQTGLKIATQTGQQAAE